MIDLFLRPAPYVLQLVLDLARHGLVHGSTQGRPGRAVVQLDGRNWRRVIATHPSASAAAKVIDRHAANIGYAADTGNLQRLLLALGRRRRRDVEALGADSATGLLCVGRGLP